MGKFTFSSVADVLLSQRLDSFNQRFCVIFLHIILRKYGLLIIIILKCVNEKILKAYKVLSMRRLQINEKEV